MSLVEMDEAYKARGGRTRLELGQVHLGGGGELAHDVGGVRQQEQDSEYCHEAWRRGHAGRLEVQTVCWEEDGNASTLFREVQSENKMLSLFFEK